MTDWEKEIGAMTLFVPDLDQARQFYQDVFGVQAQALGEDTAMMRFKQIGTGGCEQPRLPIRPATSGRSRKRYRLTPIDRLCRAAQTLAVSGRRNAVANCRP